MFQFLKNLIRRSNGGVSGWRNLLDTGPTTAGVSVNRHSAFGIPAVWRSIDLISSTVARTPVPVYRTGKNNSRERFLNHPAFALLNAEANPLQTSYQLKKMAAVSMLWAGNAYVYIEKDGDENPTALWLLDSDNTGPVITYPGNGLLPQLSYVSNGQPIPADRICHIRGMGQTANGLVGMRFVDVVRDALALPIAAQKYAGAYFKRGGILYWIGLPNPMKDKEAIETFRAGYANAHENPENAFRPPIMGAGASLNQLQGSNEAAQLQQMLAQSLVDVANLFGLPASKLGSTVNTSYASLSAEHSATLSDCYDAHFSNIEAELTKALVRETEKPRVYIEFLRDAVLSGDPVQESQRLLNELNNGGISWQEYRAIRNLPTEKDEAEEWRLPSGVVIEGAEPEPAPAPQAPQAPAPEQPAEQPQADSQKAKDIARAAVTRLIERLRRDANLYPARHHGVFAEALPGVDLEQFWDNLETEIGATLPEQYPAVIDRAEKELQEIVAQAV